MTMVSAVFNQQNFRFRTVNPLSALANAAFDASDPALNANLVDFDATSDVVFRIRFEIEETAGGGENVTWNLYCSRNGGAYFVVNNASTIVRTSDNPNYADDTATTNLIAGSARAFLAGYADDSDAVMPNAGNQAWSGNQHTELDVACTILAADVADGDTLDFQIRKTGGTTITYTRTPRITVSKAAPPITGGSTTVPTVDAEGAGLKVGRGGATATINTDVEGAGQPGTPSGGSTASVSVDAEGAGDGRFYAVFRRSPPTGAVFDPTTDTPIARTGLEESYLDANLADATYEYQVFGWDGSAWTSGSALVEAVVSAGAIPEGGSTTNPKVDAEGAGLKVGRDGATAGVNVDAEGAGFKVAQGGATAGISADAEGAGTKFVSGGATAQLTVDAEGAGTAVGGNPQGGSKATVTTDATGEGQKRVSGGSETTVRALSTGEGQKSSGEGTETSLVVSSEGQGFKTAQGGSTAGIQVDAEGAGVPVTAGAGGSTARVRADAQGAGSKHVSGGSTAHATAGTEAGGLTIRIGGSQADLTLSVEGDGRATRLGGAEARVLVDSLGGGFGNLKAGGSTVVVTVDAQGAGQVVGKAWVEDDPIAHDKLDLGGYAPIPHKVLE